MAAWTCASVALRWCGLVIAMRSCTLTMSAPGSRSSVANQTAVFAWRVLELVHRRHVFWMPRCRADRGVL